MWDRGRSHPLAAAAADSDTHTQKTPHPEQKPADLPLQPADRDQDLNAPRAASRELMTRLNTRS